MTPSVRSGFPGGAATAALVVVCFALATALPHRRAETAEARPHPMPGAFAAAHRARAVDAFDATRFGRPSEGCVSCHKGIEDMHPAYALSCVDCHGGDGKATTKEAAHVAASKPVPNDERVVPIDHDLAYRRFLNPSDLRVAAQACGDCHGALVDDVKKSLHGTTSGHLSDGYYENGVVKKKGTAFGMFPIADDDVASPHGLRELGAVPGFQAGLRADEIPTHYRDVVRKNCMQCHLWSRGRAVRGRLGMDGDYRSEGCAACHVEYSDEGFSESADACANKKEPGHPKRHVMTSKIPTETCTRCHYGDASIGLSFRGLAQLVPGQPAGPDVPGTTAKRLNGTFYVRDDRVTPPDVHHEKGMHCIDCHTSKDTMGDGDIFPVMDHAVEIECESCHGTIDATTTGVSSKGARLSNLVEESGAWWLVSKVTGKRHPVKQARHVVDPLHKDFNAKARGAMTAEHGKLECYACHASWNPNFFGFHFDRNEGFTQLDLISGQRTPGRVNTLEKVFSTFRHFQMGMNHDGKWGPWMVGFSTFCTAHAADGSIVVDQRMPATAAGLSGMTMIHHQTHTVRRTSRACAECHRSGAALGLGSGSFSLARGLAISGSSRGLSIAAVDRKTPQQSSLVADVPVGRVRDVALNVDVVQGELSVAYAATDDGVVVVEAPNPAFPKIVERLAIPGGARAVLATERWLYAAAGREGVHVYDLKQRTRPKLAAKIPVKDARGLALHALTLFVAEGAHGLTAVDVADPRNPAVVGNLPIGRLSSTDDPELGLSKVAVTFQFSRPDPEEGRTPARALAAVGGAGVGFHLIDVTEPSRMGTILSFTAENGFPDFVGQRVAGLALGGKYDLGSTGGGIPSVEHDYAWVALRGNDGRGRVLVVQVSDPYAPRVVARTPLNAAPTGLAPMRVYNPPFLTHLLVVPTERGLRILDVTRSEQPTVAATFDGPTGTGGVAVEAMAFDRLVTEDGTPLKDIAHEDARYADAAEMRRILRARIPVDVPERGRDVPADGGRPK